jgi:flagellar biosynthesis/type III secretory pathway protein FliH
MTVRTLLPLPLIEALEDYTKASQKYGYACATHNFAKLPPDEYTLPSTYVEEQALEYAHAKMVQARVRVEAAIESHATQLYEGGIELGRAEAVQ